MTKEYIFTSESVTEGHPDKMADQISDAILDYIIENDKNARVACETLVSNGFCVIAGELKTTAYAPMQEIARKVIQEIGYTDANYGFDYRAAAVLNGIGEQSPDINQGVDQADGEIGAGDQGLMFGYACRETDVLMPLPIYLAHRLTHRLAVVRKEGIVPYLRPDGKAQISVKYVGDKPVSVETVVISTQHAPDVSQEQIHKDMINEVIKHVIPAEMMSESTVFHINPTGKFVIGGPQGDAGLTGRKIIVDTYGGSCPHGGGAFSGKDPTKVDRSAAYAARWVAKNLVASGACDRATIQVAYAIGVVQPVSIMVDTHGTGKVEESKIEACVKELFDLSPKGIIESLDLLRPIYRKTAAYGHFGREDEGFGWEKTDRVDEIKKYLAL
ncbi:MAG: methionine adenosyltransferase [Epsilonproteobacteria bacterium]|nr:methionine adenosyltransferase [Campylobacterota bacterium]OIO14903.1 MAG: methionine adenosyltransferase [Helicobacteraceae bacterium CG1_02_36_14]PIP11523.1 MAG: methionine adenosyltransferase [Sulfurimonas sp. CG23_combo_of_CG06-09_8_20_14_all_36_33]PIS25479.1 MAG: methionine adenosyltransferase [Sulfurimonas sp. CG08_land_8_20_14_0_20_36_33]PIU35635.1 MAG: methionine adenosyltransferase [Sulfurimonas sp. CG07_land_8_20_14_0_80_36_56]PIV05214.1 MAG: methionine adenosyltransferase [Sulfur